MAEIDPAVAAAIAATANAVASLARTQETQAATVDALVHLVTQQGVKDSKLAAAVDGMTQQLADMQARAKQLQDEARRRADENLARIKAAMAGEG